MSTGSECSILEKENPHIVAEAIRVQMSLSRSLVRERPHVKLPKGTLNVHFDLTL
jgi:hypothetical protein